MCLSKFHYGCRYVDSTYYHLVWCVKYRHGILDGQVEAEVKQLLQ